MKDIDYAYAVARIRANERCLLSKSDVERLVSAKTFAEAVGFLKECGRNFDGEKTEIENMLENEQKKLWSLLCESVGDRGLLRVLCVQNDFFNLKAALKCMITGKDASNLFAFPTSLDLETLVSAFKTHDFELLPFEMKETAKQAYEVACRTENGQSADIIIDKAALKLFLSLSKSSDCDLLFEIAKYICACADIKIAYRSAKAGKSLAFIENALSGVSVFDKARLSKAAAKGTDALLKYLEKTPFEKEEKLISKSLAAFEKFTDDTVTETAKRAKLVFFGFEPVAAYYYAKTAELKTLRVVLFAKQSGIDEETIHERVRELYV